MEFLENLSWDSSNDESSRNKIKCQSLKKMIMMNNKMDEKMKIAVENFELEININKATTNKECVNVEYLA